MRSSTADTGPALTQDVSVTDEALEIRLTDGRTLSAPIAGGMTGKIDVRGEVQA